MDALKRKWPFLLASALSLALFLIGYSLIKSVKYYRRTSIAHTVVITHHNPLDIPWEKKPGKRWIGISYVDATTDPKPALARIRYSSSMRLGDTVVAYFGKGKVSATIASWRDWLNGIICIIIGAWLLAIGIFIRNLLEDPPDEDEESKEAKKPRKPGKHQGRIPSPIKFSFAGIGSLCLIVSAYLFLSQFEFDRNSMDLNGVVVDFRGIEYEYEYPPGSIHRIHSKAASSEWNWMNGDSIPIQVDIRNPSRAQIVSFTDQWFAAAGMGFFGLIFGGIGFGMVFSGVRFRNKTDMG